MKFITAAISAATISTVAGHCDWDMSEPFAHYANGAPPLSSTLKDGIRTLQPPGSQTAASYFKLKKGASTSFAYCDFSTVDFTTDSDFLVLGWYSSNNSIGSWGDYITLYPHKSSDQVYWNGENSGYKKWEKSPVSFGNDNEFHNFTAVSNGNWIEWDQNFMDTTLSQRQVVDPSDQYLIIEIKIAAGGHVSILEDKKLTPEYKIKKLEAQNAKLGGQVKSLFDQYQQADAQNAKLGDQVKTQQDVNTKQRALVESLTSEKNECEADFTGYRKSVSDAMSKVRAKFAKNHN